MSLYRLHAGVNNGTKNRVHNKRAQTNDQVVTPIMKFAEIRQLVNYISHRTTNTYRIHLRITLRYVAITFHTGGVPRCDLS